MRIFGLTTPFLIFLLSPIMVLASEGLDVPEALEHKVPLEGLGGIAYFFARLYNDNLLLYALVCTAIMAIVGVIISFGTDFILKAAGLEVEKIEHQE